MDEVMMPLPLLHVAVLADVTRWYRILGDWTCAIAVVLSALMDLIDCYRGVCRHG